MSVIRVGDTQKPYTLFHNEFLQGSGLSADALGVAVFLLSHPESWKIKRSHIQQTFSFGKDRCKRIVDEMVDKGFMTVTQIRDPQGRVVEVDYCLTDHVGADNPHPHAGYPHTGEPYTVNPPLIKETKKQTNKTNKHMCSVGFEKFWDAYPSRAPHPMDKAAARKKWSSRIKAGADPDKVINAAQAFAEYCAAEGTDPKFIPMPSTWLNKHRDEGMDESMMGVPPEWRNYEPYKLKRMMAEREELLKKERGEKEKS